MDKFVGQQVKIVYADTPENKAVRGVLESHDELFVYINTNNGTPLVIGKRAIVSIMMTAGDAQ